MQDIGVQKAPLIGHFLLRISQKDIILIDIRPPLTFSVRPWSNIIKYTFSVFTFDSALFCPIKSENAQNKCLKYLFIWLKFSSETEELGEFGLVKTEALYTNQSDDEQTKKRTPR